MTEEEITLKKCPFCGGEPILQNTEGDEYVISCTECDVGMMDDMDWSKEDFDGKKNVVEKWNKRASQQNREQLQWAKKAPNKAGWYIRLNAIKKPELHYVSDHRGTPSLFWGGKQENIEDILDKVEYFFWTTEPVNVSPQEGKEV